MVSVIIVIIMHIHMLFLCSARPLLLVLCFFTLLFFCFRWTHSLCGTRSNKVQRFIERVRANKHTHNYCCFIHSLAFVYLEIGSDSYCWLDHMKSHSIAIASRCLYCYSFKYFACSFFIHFICCVYFLSSSLISFFLLLHLHLHLHLSLFFSY